MHNIRSWVVRITLSAIILPSALWATPTAPKLEDRVRELKLDNGLTVVVAERHQAPVFFTLMSFRVGSCQELPNRSGLAHFLEHMLFKGSQTIGTNDYAAEAPIMEQLEKEAGELRDNQIKLQAWRYDKFEAFALETRSALPPEVIEAAGTDESKIWRATLEHLPKDTVGMPADWLTSPWILKDGGTDYWALYRDLVSHRARLAELLQEQREFTTKGEALSDVYEPHGAEGLNAFTAEDQTTYMVGLPSNCLELYFYVESDRFQHPVFREFYPEREVVQEELRNGDNEPDNILWKKFVGTAFTAHPYGRPVIGWMSDIKLTLRKDMENYFWEYYTPNNCQLTIVGDVKTDEVFALAKKYFSSWKPGAPSPEVTIQEPSQQGEKRVVVEHDSEPQFTIGWHIPASPDPDSYALSMVSQILSGGKTSRFYRSIYVDKQLTGGSPGAYEGPASRYPNLFMVDATPKAPHTCEEVEKAIYDEIDKLKTEPVSEWEMNRIRNQFRKYQLQRFASNRWLAFTLSGSYANSGDWRQSTVSMDRMMQVTPADIQRVANKYFTADNRVVATLVKKAADNTQAPAEGGK